MHQPDILSQAEPISHGYTDGSMRNN